MKNTKFNRQKSLVNNFLTLLLFATSALFNSGCGTSNGDVQFVGSKITYYSFLPQEITKLEVKEGEVGYIPVEISDKAAKDFYFEYSITPKNQESSTSQKLSEKIFTKVLSALGFASSSSQDFPRYSEYFKISSDAKLGVVVISPNIDNLYEQNEVFQVKVANPDFDSELVYEITVIDADVPPLVRIDSQFVEKGSEALIPIRLDRPSALPINLTLDIKYNSAVGGADFTLPPTSVTIPPGETSYLVSVPTAANTNSSGDKYFTVEIKDPSVGVVDSNYSKSRVTIVDNSIPTKLGFSIAAQYINESAGLATVRVNLSQTLAEDVYFDIHTIEGEAKANRDFAALTISDLSIPAGQTFVEFSLPITNDAIDEIDEKLRLIASNVRPATASLDIARAEQEITIIDDDVEPTVNWSLANSSAVENYGVASLEVSLSSASEKNIQVEVASSGTANEKDFSLNSRQISFDPGATKRIFTVNLLDDNATAQNKTIILALVNSTNVKVGSRSVHTLSLIDDDGTNGVAGVKQSFSEALGTVTVKAKFLKPLEAGESMTVLYSGQIIW